MNERFIIWRARSNKHESEAPTNGRAIQHGRPIEVKLTVEQLEPRTLLAGDIQLLDAPVEAPLSDVAEAPVTAELSAAQSSFDRAPLAPYAPFDGPVVSVVLQVTAPDGSPINSVDVGDDFVLHVLSEDLRDDPHGVFAVYLDIDWDSSLAVGAGPLQYSAEYENGHAGDTGTGTLDEAGAFSGSTELGGGMHEIFSVPLHATAAGQLAFVTEQANMSPVHDVLVYAVNDAVDPADVLYGGAAIAIADSSADDSSSSPVEAAASADGAPSAPSSDGQSSNDESLLLLSNASAAKSTASGSATPALLTTSVTASLSDDGTVSQGDSTDTEQIADQEPDDESVAELAIDVLAAKHDLSVL